MEGFQKINVVLVVDLVKNHCLIALLEKCCVSFYQGLKIGALLTDLFKAFDCLPHGLLVAE